MRRRGFTIVELVVVMVIMAILVSLGIFGVTKSQANARDAERKADIEAIARGLEQRYKNGNPKAVFVADGSNKAGEYPSVDEMYLSTADFNPHSNWNPNAFTTSFITEELPGTTAANFITPNGKKLELCLFCGVGPENLTVGKYIESNTTSGAYVYEPIDASNNICANEKCVRYNLYYRSETQNKIVTVRSEHQ